MHPTRPDAPATARNREPLLGVLREVLPADGRLLEIASGTGQHAVYFARAFPGLWWQPSDRADESLAAIAAWRDAEPSPRLLAPCRVDVETSDWHGLGPFDALLCVNMIHIAPWEATLGLFAGAARMLPAGAPMVLYGPYTRDGAHTAESNARFDESLRARDPRWGVRDLDAVAKVAKQNGFSLSRVHPMPANNLTLVFVRDGG
ncbi:MAG: DUF938 domain-containing protein [Myxococcales bacterium]|nr:DUF938 domain-containing protein [Myxococcales bacterium]